MPKRSLLKPAKNSRFPTPPSLDLYTIGETAAILGVSRRSVSNWIHEQALPAIRLGPGQRLLRVRSRDLEAFIDRGILSPPHMRTPNVNDEGPAWDDEEEEEMDEIDVSVYQYAETAAYLPPRGEEAKNGHRR